MGRLHARKNAMDGQIILALIGIVSSFGSIAFFIIKGVMDSKKKEREYERSQNVNKQDWLSWLKEAKDEIAVKQKEINDLVEKHRRELGDKDSLISRLQKQVNNQAEEIQDLQKELKRWKDKYPERKESIKEETKEEMKNDLPEFMITK